MGNRQAELPDAQVFAVELPNLRHSDGFVDAQAIPRAAADVDLHDPHLVLHHDEDVEIYLNGVLATKASGYLTDYEELPISDEAKATLKPGKNTIAVHCKQTTGGQYIDVGIVEMK